MADATIVIISRDKHFSAVVAEQVKRELALSCHNIADGSGISAMPPSAVLAIADAPQAGLPCPVIFPKTRPFRLQELLAEAEIALQKAAGEGMALGRGYTLQVKQKQLCYGGRSADLTDKETQLLQCLAEAPGESVSKEQLLKQVWGFEAALDTHTLETHIYRLRGKFRELSDGEDMILAMEGGYGLRVSDDDKHEDHFTRRTDGA